MNIPQGSHVPHGGYSSGLNHDSVVRPRYDRAYVYALAASYEWAKNVLSWVSSGFAARVKTYTPSASDAKEVGTESYFGSLVTTSTGSSYPYRDASVYHSPRTAVPWLQLMLVAPRTSLIQFHYSLWNEYGTTNNDLVPIAGGNTTLSFSCSVANASCTNGGPWSESNPYTAKGSGFKGVELKLYFSSTPAAP